MSTVTEELALIASKNSDGKLLPEDVVKFAKNPKTALHTRFTWDDTKAAHEYRLWQARQVINVELTMPAGDNREINAYVSLKSDRYNGGGYRAIADVMTDADRRAELLQQAKDEAELWRLKYRQLVELVPVFDAMAATFAKQSSKPKRKRLGVAGMAGKSRR